MRAGCLRTVAGSCPPAESPLYPHVMFGLDALLKYYAAQAQLLAAAQELVTPSNAVFQFLWTVGAADLRDGLATSSNLFLSDAQAAPRAAQYFQIALLPVLLATQARM